MKLIHVYIFLFIFAFVFSSCKPLGQETGMDNVNGSEQIPSDSENDKACVISGCNKELCGEEEMFSTCIWKEEFACYARAICERQNDGDCGWSQTPEFVECFSNSGQQPIAQ